MKVGDLVKMKHGFSMPGVIMRVDKDFYGANSAFKTAPVPRGKAIRDVRRPDFIATTRDGISDRVMVVWPDHGFTYEDSNQLILVSEVFNDELSNEDLENVKGGMNAPQLELWLCNLRNA